MHKGPDDTGPIVGPGVVSLRVRALVKLVSTMRATNAKSLNEEGEPILRFGRLFLGELWDSCSKLTGWNNRGTSDTCKPPPTSLESTAGGRWTVRR